MQSRKLGLRQWVIAMFFMAANVKGTSSVRLHHLLGVQYRAAWHLMYRRIRDGFYGGEEIPFLGPVEVDETFGGGLERSKHRSKRLYGGWKLGKAAVVGALDRPANCVRAKVIDSTAAADLHPFVVACTFPETTIYTDEHSGYSGIPRKRRTVSHSRGQYVDGFVHTSGIESFWSLIKRAQGHVSLPVAAAP